MQYISQFPRLKYGRADRVKPIFFTATMVIPHYGMLALPLSSPLPLPLYSHPHSLLPPPTPSSTPSPSPIPTPTHLKLRLNFNKRNGKISVH